MTVTKTPSTDDSTGKVDSIVVPIETPIKRGDTLVTSVTLRRPKTGELRGLLMTDVLQMDVNAMGKLLTRITDPALTKPEIDAMDPADFTSLATEAITFFVSRQAMKAASQSA
jgi:hypothetical protein